MAAHLASSLTGFDQAIAALEGRTLHPSADDNAHLIELAREVLADMHEMREKMRP